MGDAKGENQRNEKSPSLHSMNLDPYQNILSDIGGSGISETNIDPFENSFLNKIKDYINTQKDTFFNQLQLSIELLWNWPKDELLDNVLLTEWAKSKINILGPSTSAKEDTPLKKASLRTRLRDNTKRKALSSILSLDEQTRIAILTELENIKFGLSQLPKEEYAKNLKIAGAFFVTNFAQSNLTEYVSVLGLSAVIAGDFNPVFKALAGLLTSYLALTLVVPGLPSIAGMSRYFWYKYPERLVIEALKLSKKDIIFPERLEKLNNTKDIKKLFKPQELIMILEGTLPLVYVLETLRLLNLNISLDTIYFLKNIYVLNEVPKRKSAQAKG